MRLSAAAAVLLVAAPALGAHPPAVPPATPAGKPVDCVRIVNIRESRVRDDRTIDFYLRDGRVLRNVLPQPCPELGFEQAFSYQTSIDRLCGVDVITVLRPSEPLSRGATCGLGRFQPVTIAAKAR